MILDDLKNQLYKISFSIHEHMDCSTYIGNGNDFYINFNQDPCIIKISKAYDTNLMNIKVREIQQLLASYSFTSSLVITNLTPTIKEYKISFTKG